jgi:hypothetical protein
LHFCGEREQKERHLASTLDMTQEVRTRVVFDAIVSTKTFANATVPQL